VSVATIFAVHGALQGTFATRIPWIADRVHAGPGALGLALIGPALGGITTMPLAARISHRFRSRPTILVLILAWAATLVLPSLAPTVPVLFATMLILGVVAGAADVAMNANAVLVEERYGRSIMSSMHGLWSAGGLLAAAVGVYAAHRGIDARLHFAVVAAVLMVVAVVASTGVLDVRLPGAETRAFAMPPKAVLMIGLVGFAAVFAEGGTGDWCAVYLRSVTHADLGTAALAYTGFALAMTVGRLGGDHVIRALGAVRSVRVGGLVAVTGVVCVLLARVPVLAIIGFALIGLGVAVTVPLVFAAAGRTGANPAQAIAGVATIAYGAGLAAPGAIGGIASATSLTVSFGVVGALCLAMLLTAGALRPHSSTVDSSVPRQRDGDVDTEEYARS
jgi:predicted MFS family arabinose efflux permease